MTFKMIGLEFPYHGLAVTSIGKDSASIPGLVQWVKESSIALSCGVGYGCGLDLPLLWL